MKVLDLTLFLTLFLPQSGGLEILFRNQKRHGILLPASNGSPEHQPTVAALVQHLTEAFLSRSPKKELFVLDGTVRPGILVLINDVDWELEGGDSCILKHGDEVVFVSTLHGG